MECVISGFINNTAKDYFPQQPRVTERELEHIRPLSEETEAQQRNTDCARTRSEHRETRT